MVFIFIRWTLRRVRCRIWQPQVLELGTLERMKENKEKDIVRVMHFFCTKNDSLCFLKARRRPQKVCHTIHAYTTTTRDVMCYRQCGLSSRTAGHDFPLAFPFIWHWWLFSWGIPTWWYVTWMLCVYTWETLVLSQLLRLTALCVFDLQLWKKMLCSFKKLIFVKHLQRKA